MARLFPAVLAALFFACWPAPLHAADPKAPPGLDVSALPSDIDAGKVIDALSHIPSLSIPTPPAKDAASPAEGETEPSHLESLYRERYQAPEAAGLMQFGYTIFERPAQPPAPREAGPGYVLGPGDTLLLRMSGASPGEVRLQVAPDGTIGLPSAGPLSVAGLELARAESMARQKLAPFAPGAEIGLSLAELKSIRVYVVGEVESPGMIGLPSGSTVLSALAAGGGIKRSGTLRRIKIGRASGGEDEVDLYSLLLSGGRQADVVLSDRDIVFVDRIGPTVAVAGAVSQPAIYELKGEATLAEALELAGGGLPQSFMGRIWLRRFENGRTFRVMDIEVPGREALEATAVQDGDLVRVRFITSRWPRVVRLEGHVWNPEVMRYSKGMRLSNILHSPEQLKPEAITDFGLLVRYDPESTRRLVRTFPLSALLGGGYDTDLAPHDTAVVLSRTSFGIRETVSLSGAVWREGDYEYAGPMTLVDLLALGGGLKFGADPSRIQLSRKVIDSGRAETVVRKLDLAVSRSVPLQPFDSVFVPAVKDAADYRSATIGGEVRYPGTYRIREGERLSDLVRRAGGLTDAAYFYGARFTSERARDIQQKSIDRLIRDLEIRAYQILTEQAQTAASMEETEGAKTARAGLEQLFERLKDVKATGRMIIVLGPLEDFAGSEYDFTLEDGDALEVPSRPSFVSVVGSVYSPSSFLYRAKFTVEDYLAQSGGPTENADKKHAYVLRANGEVLSRDQAESSFSSFEDVILMPGDTLVMPEDMERIPYFRLVKGMTDIIFKIATTAGIAIAVL